MLKAMVEVAGSAPGQAVGSVPGGICRVRAV